MSNLADDLRNLQRPEIGEVGQPRGEDISRSSTMPHKANPVGLENVQSLWKVVMPFMITMYLDQISSHQRDLTNSASQRNIPQVLDLFDYSVRRMTRIIKNLQTNVCNLQKNFG
jgi:adenylosuccinate lyase